VNLSNIRGSFRVFLDGDLDGERRNDLKAGWAMTQKGQSLYGNTYMEGFHDDLNEYFLEYLLSMLIFLDWYQVRKMVISQ